MKETVISEISETNKQIIEQFQQFNLMMLRQGGWRWRGAYEMDDLLKSSLSTLTLCLKCNKNNYKPREVCLLTGLSSGFNYILNLAYMNFHDHKVQTCKWDLRPKMANEEFPLFESYFGIVSAFSVTRSKAVLEAFFGEKYAREHAYIYTDSTRQSQDSE